MGIEIKNFIWGMLRLRGRLFFLVELVGYIRLKFRIEFRLEI